MTISSLSAGHISSGGQSSAGTNPVAQDWKSLQSALSQGNASDAQTAYNSLLKNLANSPSGSPSADSPVSQALTKLGTAIQSGDLDGAQGDFADLRTAVRSHHLYSGNSVNYSSSANSSGGDSGVTSVVAPPYGSVGHRLNVLA
jgi:hypothetical protein